MRVLIFGKRALLSILAQKIFGRSLITRIDVILRSRGFDSDNPGFEAIAITFATTTVDSFHAYISEWNQLRCSNQEGGPR